jgi:hypothetical protein
MFSLYLVGHEIKRGIPCFRFFFFSFSRFTNMECLSQFFISSTRRAASSVKVKSRHDLSVEIADKCGVGIF